MLGDLPPYFTFAIVAVAALLILGLPVGEWIKAQSAYLLAAARVKEAEAAHWRRESDEFARLRAQVEDMRRARQ